jgi:hypothetical protein
MKKLTTYENDVASRRGFIKTVSGGCAALLLYGGNAWAHKDTNPWSVGRPAQDTQLAEYAKERFLLHWNCAQAVMEALGPKYARGREWMVAVDAACPFAAGMWKGGTCGSFTAAYMAIGLRHSAWPEKDAHYAVSAAIDRVLAFDKVALKHIKSLNCSDIHGQDMSTPEGRSRAAKAGQFTSICPKTVTLAVNETLKIN